MKRGAISRRASLATPGSCHFKAKRIAVRDQTSRWGSCSTTGVLSFSWRLILAPPFVLDYVAAHEVAHLAEMNHGAGFWALVKKIGPDFEAANAGFRYAARICIATVRLTQGPLKNRHQLPNG